MYFKFLVFIGAITNIGTLPRRRVYNEVKSEHYTLLNNNNVVVRSVKGGAIDIIPLEYISETLINKFVAELER